MVINAEISTKTPVIDAEVKSNAPLVNGNLETNGIDTSHLRIRVTNLENNTVGNIELNYNNETSVLSLITKNIKNEQIGIARNIVLPVGLDNVSYNDETKKITISLSNGTIMNVSLKESFDKVDRYIANLQNEINELDEKKLDKIAYMSASDINDYFNE